MRKSNRLVLMMLAMILVLMTVWLTGCGSNTTSEQAESTEEAATDYPNAANWYQIPEITKDVDTFYLYPTLYDGTNEGDTDFATIDNESVHAAIGMVYQGQASAFEDSTNVFVPYYRQSSMKHEMAAFAQTGNMDGALEDVPLTDVYAALDYYFEHYNDWTDELCQVLSDNVNYAHEKLQGYPGVTCAHAEGTYVLLADCRAWCDEHGVSYADFPRLGWDVGVT